MSAPAELSSQLPEEISDVSEGDIELFASLLQECHPQAATDALQKMNEASYFSALIELPSLINDFNENTLGGRGTTIARSPLHFGSEVKHHADGKLYRSVHQLSATGLFWQDQIFTKVRPSLQLYNLFTVVMTDGQLGFMRGGGFKDIDTQVQGLFSSGPEHLTDEAVYDAFMNNVGVLWKEKLPPIEYLSPSDVLGYQEKIRNTLKCFQGEIPIFLSNRGILPGQPSSQFVA